MKFLKYAAIVVVSLVVLLIAVVIIFDEDKPFATVEANGVTVEIYGDYEKYSSSSTPDGQKITINDQEIVMSGDGSLTVNGENYDLGNSKKVKVQMNRGNMSVLLQ